MKNFIFLFTLCIGLISMNSCKKESMEEEEEEMEEMQDCDTEGDCLRLTIDGEETIAQFTQGASVNLLGTTTVNFTGLQELSDINTNAIQIIIINPEEGTLNYTFTQSGEPTITYSFDNTNTLAIQTGTLEILDYDEQAKFIEGEFSGDAIDTNGESYIITDGYFKVTLQ